MSPHPLPRLNAAAIECGEARFDSLIDEDELRILNICNIDPGAAAALLRRGEEGLREDLAQKHPDLDTDEALKVALAGVLIGMCIAVFATHHANGHGRRERPVRMTDAEVDGALDRITSAVARHQGAGADNPNGLADSLRALDDVRAVFREATGIGAPR